MKIKTNKPIIYLITEGAATRENFPSQSQRVLDIIRRAVRQKVALVQLREKKLDARQIYELTAAAVRLAENSATKILVNDRADIALAAGASGVHLTEKSLAAEIIRREFPADFIIGVSAHTMKKAAFAKTQGADFVTFSPIFATPGKGAAQGLEKLREVCETLAPFPVIALGGIDETNYRTVLANAASGFAAIRFLHRCLSEGDFFKEIE